MYAGTEGSFYEEAEPRTDTGSNTEIGMLMCNAILQNWMLRIVLLFTLPTKIKCTKYD